MVGNYIRRLLMTFGINQMLSQDVTQQCHMEKAFMQPSPLLQMIIMNHGLNTKDHEVLDFLLI